MFANCIRNHIHPATYAVVGLKNETVGQSASARGTAFGIDSKGHLLTCWHVPYWDEDCTIECDELMVVQPEIDLTKRYIADVVAREKDRDLAVLKIRDESVKSHRVHLEGPAVSYGASCATFGHPIAVSAPNGIRIFTRASAGLVSMPYVDPRFPGCRQVRLYELDFFAHGGISGAPLFLRTGRVFGVMSGSRLLPDESGKLTRSNLSLAIDIREAIDMLHGLGIQPQVHGSIGGK